MIYGLKTILKYALGIDRADRNFAVYPDDVMIVSYPRSGNTWTRFLIASLLHPEFDISFTNIEALIPDTAVISSRALKRTRRPRVIKSHEYFDHRYPRVIYIVRDPRDVVLSLYDFQRKSRQIDDAYPLERYTDDFVNGRLNSASWGTWRENVASWISTRDGNPNFLLLRYEDMLEETRQQLERIAGFLNLSTTSATFDHAIERSSATRMREMEKAQQNDWVATKKHRKDIPFVQGAIAGRWRTKLPEASALRIESAWGELMVSLGYPVGLSVGKNLSGTASLVTR